MSYSVNDFYDYARLAEEKKQKMTHKGVIVVQPQVGTPDSTNYIPTDLTVGLIDPIIIYPQSLTRFDLPGKVGGPKATSDNSLTYSGAPKHVAEPVSAQWTIPDHVRGAQSASQLDLAQIQDSIQGEDATIQISLFNDQEALDVSDVAFEADLGSGFITVAGTKRWDGALVFNLTLTLDMDSETILNIKTTIDSAANAGTYTYDADIQVAGEKVASASEDFNVT